MPRIPARALTPALRAELRTFSERLRPKGFARAGPHDEREREAERLVSAYDLLAIPFGALVGVGGMTSVVDLVAGRGVTAFGPICVVVGIAFAFLVERLKPHGASPSARFLSLALPSLDLSPTERRYAEVLTLGGPPERLELLRRLTDESARLDALAARLGPASDGLARERDAIRTDLARATDPAAHAALARSLELAESRLAEAARADPIRQRLAAHRTLLDQSARSVAEGLALRDPLPETTLTRAASLGEEVAALEAAVAEMRAL